MKSFTASALLALIVCPIAMAQQGGQAPPPVSTVQRELLELEQEVDKTLLREAMLLLGRKELRPNSERPGDDGAKKVEESEATRLKSFIQSKKDAISDRSAELNKARGIPVRAANLQPLPRANELNEQERRDVSQKVETAQIEFQLLQRQVELSQQPLTTAVEELAIAELDASDDETKKEKAEGARKKFEKAKNRFVALNKKLQEEQRELGKMQQSLGMGGMSGMGGGFR